MAARQSCDTSLACADMLLHSHEEQGGSLLMPSAHGSSNYSSEMRSLVPGESGDFPTCCTSAISHPNTLTAPMAVLAIPLLGAPEENVLKLSRQQSAISEPVYIMGVARDHHHD